ncbi:MAG: CbiQ family ECF transporter T component [Cyanobacteriota bacterium]|nr:CbiQ family ECF transporter T component [Cyanobacteriota bacterium]
MDLLRSLPIGLYLEQPVTWLHRLDPRVKMVWLMSILVTPILANATWRIGLVGLLLLLTLMAGIPLRVWRQQLGWLVLLSGLVMVLTFILPDGLEVNQPDRWPAPGLVLPQPTAYGYVLLDWGPFTVTRRSLELGIRVGTLLFTLIYGTNLYLLTTAPEEITLALESLMAPLRWLRLPVTEIALTVTLSLRFIPLVLEEVQNLVRSVQTRAINWKKLGLRQSAQVWLVVVERLLENLLLRAEQIAAAMAVRGFTSPNQHQVRWHQLRLQPWDGVCLGVLVLFWWARWRWGGQV